MIIGITGNSGAGKTTVSKILAQITNGKIINADEIVKEEQKVGKPYYKEIVNKIGKHILTKTLEIDREKLANEVFINNHKREEINKITNNFIVPIIKEKAEMFKGECAILDVPLLFETGLDKICDYTIAVVADEKTKAERLTNRDKKGLEIIKQRMNIQPKDEYYINLANYIIENNNQDIEKKVEKIWKRICLKHGNN